MSDERFLKQGPPGRDTTCEPRERKWGFYNYTRFNWGKHLNLCGTKVSQSYAMRRKTFLDSNLAFDSWKLSLSPRVVRAPGTPTSAVHIVETAIDRVVGSVFSSWYSRVLASCMFGMTDFLRELLAQAEEGTAQYALLIAVYCQQPAVVEMLIQRDDVDVNERPDGANTTTLLYRANQLGVERYRPDAAWATRATRKRHFQRTPRTWDREGVVEDIAGPFTAANWPLLFFFPSFVCFISSTIFVFEARDRSRRGVTRSLFASSVEHISRLIGAKV